MDLPSDFRFPFMIPQRGDAGGTQTAMRGISRVELFYRVYRRITWRAIRREI